MQFSMACKFKLRQLRRYGVKLQKCVNMYPTLPKFTLPPHIYYASRASSVEYGNNKTGSARNSVPRSIASHTLPLRHTVTYEICKIFTI
jgi:hypothetical protein